MISNCADITDFVTRYVENDLSWGQRLLFGIHMAGCPSCRRYVRQMRATRDALGAMPPIDPPPEIRDALLERFGAWIEETGDGETNR